MAAGGGCTVLQRDSARPSEKGEGMKAFAPRQILCAVDLGPASQLVLGWARLFAQAFGARVDVLHSDWGEPPRYFTPAQIEVIEAEAENRKAKLLDELAGMARQVFGPQAELAVNVVEGHPVPVLREHIQSHRPDLLVLGSHGRSGVARLMMGSVAENIVRESPCPALVVRGGETAPPAIGRILCPVSFTETGRGCLETSAALAAAFHARLDVLHAAEEPGARPEEVHDRLCQWVPSEARGHCEITEIVRHGRAAEQIILQAREHPVDMMVLAGEHRPLLEMTTLGTTTERVMRHSPCSVLVLPRGLAQS
jgi:nucleotide-binding universal stress UspA family protein